MLTQERRQQILDLLAERGSVSVSQLSDMLNSSESTIRRDLVALSKLGKLNKVHGGATILSQEFLKNEDNIEVKSLKKVDEKNKIAQYASSQINDDDFVFIDAGSTTYLLTTYINDSKATFVTNGIAHAKQLAKNGCKVFVLGGELKETTEAIIGLVAATNLQKYNFSKAFIGTNGISEKQGFTTPDTDEAMLKAIAIERSFVSYVLADESKFGKVSAVTFAPLDSACIVCDKCNDDTVKQKSVVKEVGI
jgi:DeoR family fructose operon transcriptional repressor